MNAPIQHPPVVRTTCPYCGVGCGVLAKPDGRGGAVIAGDPEHPSNFGRLCSKGFALGETLGLCARLLHPMLRQDDGTLARADWDSALDRVADGFRDSITKHGPDAVAFYLSGQLLTEDYYVANKLLKGFVGTANVDTNSRLCMASSVAGHRRAFGADTVPGVYADLDQADLLVLVGSNAAWCHPVLLQRMLANKRERGARIVVIDPRRTVTADDADLFLPVAPGMDTVLFSGLLVHLHTTGALDRDYIERHTENFPAALTRASEIAPDIATIARATKIPAGDIACFYDWFRTTPRAVTCFSQGVNQSAQGTDKVNAIINCHLATGRIGRPGMGPFSLTGQPNAMGGREVGGLANQLAAHMGFAPADVDRVRRFWNAPRMATREGRKAVAMFDAIARGEIRALWVMATNPAVSLPRADAVRDALRKLDLFVVSENVLSNDTVNCGAHVLLPAAAWGEKDGTVTNSERRISRQRPFLPLPGEAKPDWWMVAKVAERLGYGAAFAYRNAADVFREHAALSTFENDGTRDFDIGALADVSDCAYDALNPVQWPLPRHGGSFPSPRLRGEGGEQRSCEPGEGDSRCAQTRGGAPSPDLLRASRSQVDLSPQAGRGEEGKRFFAGGRFFTPGRKAQFVAPELPSLAAPTSDAFPFRLNTGRVRDQWHTMTRTGLSPALGAHMPLPFVAVNPDDAVHAGLVDGGFARVTTAHGAGVLSVRVDAGQQRGSLFAPIHWSGATASSARIGALVAPDNDPHSGQPEAKATPASIAPVAFASRGFALSRAPLALPADTWWARVAVDNGHGLLFAADLPLDGWRDYASGAFANLEMAEYLDAPRGVYRVAAFAHGRLDACLYVAPAAQAPAWDAVRRLFELDEIEGAQRRILLSGRAGEGLPDMGPLICACFGVGLNVIRAAIASGQASDTETIGKALRAGTNCGSCLPELKRIVHDHATHAA